VLADVERVDPDGLREDGLLDGVADDLVAARASRFVPRDKLTARMEIAPTIKVRMIQRYD
jgi:hypothetical protein